MQFHLIIVSICLKMCVKDHGSFSISRVSQSLFFMNQGQETKEIENQPRLKNFNLKLILICNIYKRGMGTTLNLTMMVFKCKSIYSVCLRILGVRSLSLPPNEPPTNLERNSADLQKLKAEMQRVQNETVEIPCIVGGKEVLTGNTHYQVAVSKLRLLLPQLQSWTEMLRKMHLVCLIFSSFPLKPGSLNFFPPPPPPKKTTILKCGQNIFAPD